MLIHCAWCVDVLHMMCGRITHGMWMHHMMHDCVYKIEMIVQDLYIAEDIIGLVENFYRLVQ